MSWPQWSAATAPQPPVVAAAAPMLNPAPAVVPPSLPYGTDQWAQMQQQNWQQWAQWQQQYQQWHQQYGAEYHKSINALAAQQTTVPNLGVPPPLPTETQPPLPKDESPKPPPLPIGLAAPQPQQPPVPQFSTQQPPPPRNQFSAPPPNFTATAVVAQPEWDQKRPLVQADESASKRQMVNRSGWKSQTGQNWQPQPPQPPPPNTEELSDAEKKFDKQFAEWEAQFNKWKEQNSGHPDKQQYREYEKKWEQWRQQLLDRREAMRKKRLGLAVPNKVPQNFSVPPPTQAPPPSIPQTVLPPKPPPPNAGTKEGLLPTPNMFTKPPPDMNNEPLQFKKTEQEQEPPEGTIGFLSSSKSEGIPGLDLVRDGGADFNENDEPPPQKGPDLEAISKGISNILGDQKLMNMLSMVSQNQSTSQTTNVNTTSRINETLQQEQSNLSAEDSRNETLIQTEMVQNFDDQTRSSFTTLNDSDYYRGTAPPPTSNNQFSRPPPGNFESEPPPPFGGLHRFEPPKSIGGPPPANRFGRGIDSFGQNRETNRNEFDRNPLGSRENNSYIRSMPPGVPVKSPLGGPGGMCRDSFGSGVAGGKSYPSSDNANRGRLGLLDTPSRENPGFPINREGFRGVLNRDDFIPQEKVRDNFAEDRGPPDTFGPTKRGPMGRDNFESEIMNRDNRPPFDRGNFDSGRNNFGARPFDDKFHHREGPDNRLNKQSKNFGYINDEFESSPSGLQRFGDGPPGRRDVFDPPPPRNFGQIPPNMRTREPIERFESEFDNRSNMFNEPPSYEDEGGPRFRESDYAPPPPLMGRPGSNDDRFSQPRPRMDSFGNSSLEAPEPPRLQREGLDVPKNEFESMARPVEPPVEDIWKPATVIDYEHKPLKQPEMDILVEPFRMFDYRHKTLRRIPFPDRPNWLSDTVRMIPEFDPPIIRAPVVERRLYDDRYEPPPPPLRRDDRYDAHSRPNDRYRYERGGYDMKFSPPPSRRNEDHQDTWRRNRSRSPPKFERHPVGGDRRRNLSRDRDREPRDERWAGGRNSWEDDTYEDRDQKGRGGERWKNKGDWEERARQWEEDDMDLEERDRSRDSRYRNRSHERDGSFGRKPVFPLSKPPEEQKKTTNITPIEDILNSPGRVNRPPRIVIILRGPPGSGKTFLAKIIKDKEVENGGSAPRILSLDDYFMVEQEKEVMEDGKMVKMKDMVYEFEAEMEESYRTSLMRSFKKTITDGYFPFIIVDNVNDKVKHFGEMWSFAKQNGFQVYICQLDLHVQNCTKRNIHNRTEDEIRKCVDGWEKTPSHHPVLDATSLLQDEPIREVEMEEVNSPGSGGKEHDEGLEDQLDRSKWDNFDCSLNNLARLDGVNKPLRPSRTMEEYLQLDDEWTPTNPTKPGQKRVRWADLEERKQQEKMRAIGFVVGHTNWERMMDPSMGESALTQTKYIEKVQRRKF